MTVGSYPDGQVGEVFADGAKAGTAIEGLLDDACILVSRLLQHGVEPQDFAGSMGRLGDRQPASAIGAVVDLLVQARP